jgi:phosphoserine phosphatase
MKTIDNERIACFDVDDTLVLWGEDAKLNTSDRVEIMNPHTSETVSLVPHRMHINLLKEHFSRGYYVIVWSQAGYEWASTVVNALGLAEYVSCIMTKPTKYVDDLPSNNWMGSHLYFKDRK